MLHLALFFAAATHLPQQAALGDLRAQNFQVTTLEGTPMPLAELLPANKPAVIEFWATWCSPCRKTMPELIRLHDEFAAKGLVVIGLTMEDPARDLDKVRSFARQMGVSYTVAFAPPELFRYATKAERIGLPKIIVYDAAGNPAETFFGYNPLTNRHVREAVAAVAK